MGLNLQHSFFFWRCRAWDDGAHVGLWCHSKVFLTFPSLACTPCMDMCRVAASLVFLQQTLPFSLGTGRQADVFLSISIGPRSSWHLPWGFPLLLRCSVHRVSCNACYLTLVSVGSSAPVPALIFLHYAHMFCLVLNFIFMESGGMCCVE